MPISDPAPILPHSVSPPAERRRGRRVSAANRYGAIRLSDLGQEAEFRQAELREDLQRVRSTRQAAARPPLGIVAEFSTTPPQAAPFPARRAGPGADKRVKRRYARQETAARLLPGWRIAHCQKTPTGGDVAVNYHAAHGTASYGGLQTCGSAWICPVCAAKIAARRTAELQQGVAAWRARKGHLYMMTLTVRHRAGQPLAGLQDGIKHAYGALHQDRRWKLAAARWGIIGYVTAAEHTHGDAGWHPHLHALLFVTDDLADALPDLQEWMAKRWRDALAKFGLDATLAHGTDIRPADDKASEYIGKLGRAWTTAAELGAGGQKMGRQGNRTPAELLDLAAQGDVEAGELYQEYAAATRGDSWLRWSKGLRDLCGLAAELSDGELAEEQTEDATNMTMLTREQWAAVRRKQIRGDLLAEAGSGDVEQLRFWLLGYGIVIHVGKMQHHWPNEEPPEKSYPT